MVGDTILDRFIYGKVERVSPESPSLVLDQEREEEFLGGACNVAANIRTLSNDPQLKIDYFGVASSKIIRMLEAFSISFVGVAVLDDEKILTKTRFVSSNHHLLRLDRKKIYDADVTFSMSALFKNLRLNDYDVIIVSDYNKGTVAYSLCESIFDEKFVVPVLFDIKKCHDWIFDFGLKNCIFKCNRKEFEEGVDKIIFSGAKNLVITQGADGYKIYNLRNLWDGKHFPSIKLNGNVADVVGAGDVFMAGMAVNFLETKEFDANAMAQFGNICAAKKVQYFGIKTIERKEL